MKASGIKGTLPKTGQLVFIGGAGRSGSTLLDLLLNNNPHIQSVGEIHRLNHYARTDQETCTCGRNVMACPFWLEVQKAAEPWLPPEMSRPLLQTLEMMIRPQDLSRVVGFLEKITLVFGRPAFFRCFVKLFCRPHHAALQNSLFWYEMVRQVTGQPVVVDSTKDARRLKALYMINPQRFKLIYLVRDGRAVAASAMRRVGQDMTTAARSWASANQRSMFAQRGIPASRIFKLKYETLCAEPETTLREVCSFLDVGFDSRMLLLNKSESHNIGGNPMRFRQGESQIVLDERWHDQLSLQDLAEFERIAGSWNRRLGYE